MHLGCGFARGADGLDLIGRRNAQDRAALQRVDVVLVERVRILLEHRQHQLIDVGRLVRAHVARDAGQRVAGFHRVFAGQRPHAWAPVRPVSVRARVRVCSVPRRAARRQPAVPWPSERASVWLRAMPASERAPASSPPRSRRSCRVAGAITGGSSSTVYSRSRRPFGQFASTRKSRNGSLIDFLAGDLDHHVAVAALDQRELERHREPRAIESDAIEILGGCELHEQPFRLAGRCPEGPESRRRAAD